MKEKERQQQECTEEVWCWCGLELAANAWEGDVDESESRRPGWRLESTLAPSKGGSKGPGGQCSMRTPKKARRGPKDGLTKQENVRPKKARKGPRVDVTHTSCSIGTST